MNNTLALGVVVSGRSAYVVLGFAAIGVFATAKTAVSLYQNMQSSFGNESR